MSWPRFLRSMRWRIALSLAALGLAVVLAQAAAFLLMFDDKEEEFIDALLEQQMDYSLSIWPRSHPSASPNTPDMHLYVVQPSGTFGGPVPPAFAYLPPGNHEVFVGGKEYHVAVRDQASERFILTYDVEDHEARWDAFLWLTSSALLVFCVLLAIAGYFLASRLSGRLERLAARVDDTAAASLREPGMELELESLAVALDGYRGRQARAVARERAFAANLSHELRTPLTAIRTDAELLAALPDVPESVGRRGRRIVGSVDRISALAESLLLLARDMQPGGSAVLPLRVCIEDLWQAMLAASGKPLELACSVPATATLQADPALFDLVLRNLIDNALRHSQEGVLRCRLDARVLRLHDSGPGFAEAEFDQVFERFYSARPGGTGIGLALVRHVCEACGWQVGARNHPEGGGEVWVDFGDSVTVPAG